MQWPFPNGEVLKPTCSEVDGPELVHWPSVGFAPNCHWACRPALPQAAVFRSITRQVIKFELAEAQQIGFFPVTYDLIQAEKTVLLSFKTWFASKA